MAKPTMANPLFTKTRLLVVEGFVCQGQEGGRLSSARMAHEAQLHLSGVICHRVRLPGTFGPAPGSLHFGGGQQLRICASPAESDDSHWMFWRRCMDVRYLGWISSPQLRNIEGHCLPLSGTAGPLFPFLQGLAKGLQAASSMVRASTHHQWLETDKGS